MRKLNNKGMTIVEILVCFVLTVIVLVSMYTSVSVYSNKRSVESNRQQILTFKNTVTKDIMGDLTKYGVSNVDVKQEKIDDADDEANGADMYTVEFTLAKSSETRRLVIKRRMAYDANSLGYNNTITHTYIFFNLDGSEEVDNKVSSDECDFIESHQGSLDEKKAEYYDYCASFFSDPDKKLSHCGDEEKKILPFLIADRDRTNVIDAQDVQYCREVVDGNRSLEGFVQSTVVAGVTDNRYDDYFLIQYNGYDYSLPELGTFINDNGKTVYDLRLADVIITAENDVVNIHIVLQHRDFGNRYAINLVVPYGI